VAAAANDGARLVVLPEFANYLADDGKLEHAESLDGATVCAYRDLARRHGILFHCGSFLETSGDPRRAYNTSVLIAPDGEIIATYRKIHLFDVAISGRAANLESAHIKPGDRSVVAETPLGGIGMAICYDVRFPELFRTLTDNGAAVITMPAAFTLYTGKDHWEVLLRARAIENQVFIVAPGQWGNHPTNRSCFGSSMIIDPWGTVLARASEGVGYVVAPIDPALQIRVRQQIPCLGNRRPFD
jgi:deaminated glutathione amidase